MISVIMATYREPAAILREAVESILNQTYRDFEFIIIQDDPSNEEHLRILKEYQAKDSRIRFYINPENLGLRKTLNRGISLITGDYVARMDADDISMPERFSKQLYYLISHDYDLIGGDFEMIDENGNPIYSVQNLPSDSRKIKKALRYTQCIAHPTWMAKRIVFDTLKSYRAVSCGEDLDFTLRAAMKGFRISNLNEKVLKYRMTSASISRSNLFKQYLEMRFLTRAYALEKVADLEEMNAYVEKHNTPKEESRYTRANTRFTAMLRAKQSGKLISFYKNGVKLLFSSGFFLNKIYRLVRMQLYSK